MSGPWRTGGGVAVESDANPIRKAHNAPRCTVRAKTTGNRCKAPARRGWKVCRMHGAGGGEPFGPGNGAWVHGDRSQAAEQDRRTLMALVAHAQDHEITEADAREALTRLDPLWDELFPAEHARIAALLVERIDIGTGGLNVRLRMDGLTELAREMMADLGTAA